MRPTAGERHLKVRDGIKTELPFVLRAVMDSKRRRTRSRSFASEASSILMSSYIDGPVTLLGVREEPDAVAVRPIFADTQAPTAIC